MATSDDDAADVLGDDDVFGGDEVLEDQDEEQLDEESYRALK
jgi:hypothetical protein